MMRTPPVLIYGQRRCLAPLAVPAEDGRLRSVPVVSDAPRSGWWLASDGRWYPPDARRDGVDDVFPAGPPPTASVATAGKAKATLTLGIVSFVVCPVIAAIAAIVVGAQADRQIRESYGRLRGEDLVKAGRILAIMNLALSVFMVPVLLAVAVPTFLGARERAQDRAAQSRLTVALSAQREFFTDDQVWADDPRQLQAIEPSLRYEIGAVPVVDDVIYVVVESGIVGLGAKSASGTCFYVMASGFEEFGYAKDEACGPVQTQDYLNRWE